MTLQTDTANTFTGLPLQADALQISRDAMLNTNMSSPVSVVAGTGAPTFTAPKGTLYSNITGSSTSTRLYVNTDGGTTWTNFTSAA